ncbi:hypothetical protein [Geminicoccus flavidas]|uniref:hypothetical protein n=1 Tax=Geminicoccus flavidas TaxID=2506407 RepID=UPI0013599B6F|nr:hypothetical protein [Geminicoccus flavidas]
MPDLLLLLLLLELGQLAALASWPCLFLPLLFLRRIPGALPRPRPMRLRVIARDGSERQVEVLPSRDAFYRALLHRPTGTEEVRVHLHPRAS